MTMGCCDRDSQLEYKPHWQVGETYNVKETNVNFAMKNISEQQSIISQSAMGYNISCHLSSVRIPSDVQGNTYESYIPDGMEWNGMTTY